MTAFVLQGLIYSYIGLHMNTHLEVLISHFNFNQNHCRGVFEISLFCSPRLYLFDQKCCKTDKLKKLKIQYCSI